MPVKSTRRMTKSPDPLILKVESCGSFYILLLKYWSQISDLLAGSGSPQEDDGNTKEEESGSGDDSTYANQDPTEGEVGDARRFWDNLPADTKRDLAREEFVNFETNKQFQMYLKALILEAKNMHQKNYLEFM